MADLKRGLEEPLPARARNNPALDNAPGPQDGPPLHETVPFVITEPPPEHTVIRIKRKRGAAVPEDFVVAPRLQRPRSLEDAFAAQSLEEQDKVARRLRVFRRVETVARVTDLDVERLAKQIAEMKKKGEQPRPGSTNRGGVTKARRWQQLRVRRHVALNVIDVSEESTPDVTMNDVPMKRERVVADQDGDAAMDDSDDFVYDLYGHDGTEVQEDDAAAQDVVHVDELVEDMLLYADDDDDEADYDSDDSNAENYYGNDYPDEPDYDEEDSSDDGGRGIDPFDDSYVDYYRNEPEDDPDYDDDYL